MRLKDKTIQNLLDRITYKIEFVEETKVCGGVGGLLYSFDSKIKIKYIQGLKNLIEEIDYVNNNDCLRINSVESISMKEIIKNLIERN